MSSNPLPENETTEAQTAKAQTPEAQEPEQPEQSWMGKDLPAHIIIPCIILLSAALNLFSLFSRGAAENAGMITLWILLTVVLLIMLFKGFAFERNAKKEKEGNS